MKRRKDRNQNGTNPGKLAEHYMKRAFEQLVAALDRGDVEGAKDLMLQLIRIDGQRDLLGAKMSAAIDRLEQTTGIDFRHMLLPSTLEDEAISNQRAELLAMNLAICAQKEVTELGPRWAKAQAGYPDEAFGEDMQKMGARLIAIRGILDALGNFYNWIETSPDAAWHRTLPPAKKDDDEPPGPVRFWKA